MQRGGRARHAHHLRPRRQLLQPPVQGPGGQRAAVAPGQVRRGAQMRLCTSCARIAGQDCTLPMYMCRAITRKADKSVKRSAHAA